MERKSLLVIRIRGGVNVSHKVEDTLRMLRVDRNMTATLIDDRPEYLGMLQTAKDNVTWGEPTVETVSLLFSKRGKLVGDHPIGGDSLSGFGYDSIESLAKAFVEDGVEFHKLEGVKPFFRLHPPKKGFKRSVKRPYNNKGELGYRGEAINELAKRMC